VRGRSSIVTIPEAGMTTSVGRVLDALAKSKHAENTIVVLWSDHGRYFDEKTHWRKHALWEEATQCVITIAAPGVTERGGRCSRTVSLLDLYPTLIELCGLPENEKLEGRSLVPLLRDPKAMWDRPAITTYGMNNHAVRSERWRYIRYEDGTEELYDHESDRLEWHNPAGAPGLAEQKQELARWLPKLNRPPLPSAPKG
jgi:arylsulfatase A-like enzyme